MDSYFLMNGPIKGEVIDDSYLDDRCHLYLDCPNKNPFMKSCRIMKIRSQFDIGWVHFSAWSQSDIGWIPFLLLVGWWLFLTTCLLLRAISGFWVENVMFSFEMLVKFALTWISIKIRFFFWVIEQGWTSVQILSI